MKRILCPLGLVAVMVVAMTGWAGPLAVIHVLDGIHVNVRVLPADGSAAKGDKGFDDTLRFADGKFTSAAFGAKGFQPALYNGERERTEAEFEVEQTNSAGDVLNWLGNIRNGHVGGHLHWEKKDGTRTAYYFNGTEDSNGGSSTNAGAVPSAHP